MLIQEWFRGIRFGGRRRICSWSCSGPGRALALPTDLLYQAEPVLASGLLLPSPADGACRGDVVLVSKNRHAALLGVCFAIQRLRVVFVRAIGDDVKNMKAIKDNVLRDYTSCRGIHKDYA